MWDVSPVPEATMQRVFRGQNKFCEGRVWKRGVRAFSEPLPWHLCTLCLREFAFPKDCPGGVYSVESTWGNLARQ